MARKEKQYHFIYKTTNVLNGKYYYGMHSTDNLNDGYLGSGRRLKRSLNKYGKENHKVEHLEFLPNRKALIEREKEIVDLNEIAKKECMNLKIGGDGGFPIGFDEDTFHRMGGRKSGKIHAERIKNDPEYAKRHNMRWQEMVNNARLTKKCYYDWTGKKHTADEKKKIGIKNSKTQLGVKNSQFNTCWITNGKENKKIQKESEIPIGWRLGRIIN